MSGKQNKRRLTRATAGGAALLLGVGLLPLGLMSTQPANAAGVSAGLELTVGDVQFILKQIQISEAHATKGTGAPGGLVAPTSVLDCTVQPCVADPREPFGLRQVDGRGNNLFAASTIPANRTAMDPALPEDLGAADRAFPRLGTPNWRNTENLPASPIGPIGASNYTTRGTSVADAQPRVISNLIVDQDPNTNDAAATAAGGPATDGVPGPQGQQTALILNVPPGGAPAPGQPAAPPTNGMFTLFGQFFDHGLDLVGKTGTEAVVVPLDATDPLTVPSGTDFIIANRTILGSGDSGMNSTTSWIDQNQTYASHASKQVFLRAYAPTGPNGAGEDTGKLLDGGGPNAGYIADWAETKLQAANLLGIALVDTDVFNVPLLLTDEYGNFIPGPNGLPQMVLTAGGVREGNLAVPVGTTGVTKTGHAFLDDIAHNAVPDASYDAALLGRHFITGDGRGNENIGLTAVHTMFHLEHNRLVDDINAIVSGNAGLNTGFNAAGWTREQRLFQAARVVNEMEYQHAVFEEFARTFSPGILPFATYNPSILQPDIPAEFAHAVYRFGHSMLRETVERQKAGGNQDNISLISAFLNPDAFKDDPDVAGNYANAAEAAGVIARGMNQQRGSEIDEFVTSALRNSLLGLPLDLGTLNIVRGRDTGTPSLNGMRTAVGLAPYANWGDFGAALGHPESLRNFVAAYAVAPGDILASDSLVVGNDVNRRRAAADDLMNDVGFATTSTGLNNIDLWVGGLAERRNDAAGELLGPTFNAVFADAMLNLQDGDRFYYLFRLEGLNLLSVIEGNTISEMFQRNTDATVLPANLFTVPAVTVDLERMPAPLVYPLVSAGAISDITGPVNIGGNAAAGGAYTRNVTYNGGVDNLVVGGTTGRDWIRTDGGDDTVRAGDNADFVNGGIGADITYGGTGNDILVNTGGADLMTGGPGHDVLNGGPDGDIMNGLTGDDYMESGIGGVTTLGGTGNDRMLGSVSPDGLTGDDGDDWLEGGAQDDALTGDMISPFGIDLNTPGQDVLIGGNGVDAYDGGGLMDVFVGESNVNGNLVLSQVDDYLGGLGFDWTTYLGSRTPSGMGADLSNQPVNPNNFDTYAEVEALSGGAFADTLRGDSRSSLVRADGNSDALGADEVASIAGLQALIGTNNWSGGNVLIGGNGADELEGRGGNDVIDGDAYLQVQLNVTGVGLVDSLAAVSPQLLNGTLNPSAMSAAKSIVYPASPTGADVAVFSGNSSAYAVTGSGVQFTVVGPDGTDIVRNVETLRFANGDFAPASLVGAVVTPPAPGGGSSGGATGGSSSSSSSAATGGGGGGSTAAVLELRPAVGPTAGGTRALILGYGFWGATGATVGGKPVQSFRYIDAATLEIVTPSGTAGWQDVIVTLPIGNTKAGFLYQEPAAGGASAPGASNVAAVAPATVATTTAVVTPTKRIGAAPSVPAKAGQVVTVKATGLPKSTLVTVRVKVDGTWVVIGKVLTNKKGVATLPPFLAAKAGTYPVEITGPNGYKSFIKVVAG